MEETCTEISVIRALVALCFIFSPRAFISTIVSTGFHFMAAEEGYQNNTSFTAVKSPPLGTCLVGGGQKNRCTHEFVVLQKKIRESKNTLNTNLRAKIFSSLPNCENRFETPPQNMLMGGGCKKIAARTISSCNKITRQSKNTLNTNLRAKIFSSLPK